ncbi:hypothetical protein J7T55_000103 [Diaporthe amygdali]|uniref:uncharacterized protein n=1 Tax=Phomopsis amygdali TaxID=1214568 RepID=UPI0022FEFC9F|nr:uncharacterized protein J7T55_000103 [Diaporthe amygdali]KAJ0100714.1 hypothetical protein J7T55_000103 [Diaporthe amygdali]
MTILGYNHSQRLRGLAKRAIGVRSWLRDENTKFLVPYNRNPDYVDRSMKLQKVKEIFGYIKGQAGSIQEFRFLALVELGKLRSPLHLFIGSTMNLLIRLSFGFMLAMQTAFVKHLPLLQKNFRFPVAVILKLTYQCLFEGGWRAKSVVVG